MKFKISFCFLVTLAMTKMFVKEVDGGAASSGKFFHDMSYDEKLMNTADFLAMNPEITKRLFKIMESVEWLTNSKQGADMGAPMLLDILPTVLNHSLTKLAVGLAFDEIGRASPENNPEVMQSLIESLLKAHPQIPMFNDLFNKSLAQMAQQKAMNDSDKFRFVNRFLNYMNAEDLFAEPNSNVASSLPNAQCRQDTSDFLNALIGARVEIHANQSDRMSPLIDPNIQRPMWAVNMFDTFGKPTHGIFKGALSYVGSFDQCNDVRAYLPRNDSLYYGLKPHDHDTIFKGRFCRVTFNLPEGLSDSFGVDTRGIVLRLHWGMCFPDSCHSDDVNALFHSGQFRSLNLSIFDVYCAEDLNPTDDTGAQVAIAILAVLGGVVVFATLFEAWIIFYSNNFSKGSSSAGSFSSIEDNQPTYTVQVHDNKAFVPDTNPQNGDPNILDKTYAKMNNENLPKGYVHHKEGIPVFKDGLNLTTPSAPTVSNNNSPPPSYTRQNHPQQSKGAPPLIKAFSILTNMPKVLSGTKSANAVHCLHGIRFFSMLWVILGHTYNYGIISDTDNPTAGNLVDVDPIFKRFTFQGVQAAPFAVDTFFLLSGFLVTWLTLKDMKKSSKGVCYWVMFYFHRFWRLTPLYMIVLMVFTCLHVYLGGGGPLWPNSLEPAENCKDVWWTNLLYVNNVVHVDKMCMGWTWYLSDDMQFYWISPIFIALLFFVPAFGLFATTLLALAGIATSFAFEFINGGDVFRMHEAGSEYWKEVYVPPWTRVAAYAVGIFLGYIMYKSKKRTLKMKWSVIGWVLTWITGIFLCYITYTSRREGGEKWPRWWQSLFESTSRPLWAMCVGWIIYACHNNRGGFINSILSWEGLLPLSRLTYAAYLVHPIIMMLHAYSKRSLYYVGDFDMVYLFMGHAVTSYLTAFVFSLVAEAPALNLEKLLFRRH